MIWYLNGDPLTKNQNCAVPLGVQGDNESLVYTADVSDWLEVWPLGVIALVLQAPDGSEAYMGDTSLDRETGVVSWTITEFDTSVVGYGKGELRIVSGDVVKKSWRFATYIRPSVLATAADPPAPTPEWISDLLEAASDVYMAVDAATRAETAAGNAEGSATAASGSAGAAEAAKIAAEGFADDAEESAQDAKMYAQLAEMSAETHGIFEMQINDEGHLLYICTESFDDITFNLVNGRLVYSYGT
jgi:hypothetical protein